MSEPIFPGTPTDAAPTPHPVEEAPSGGNRKALMALSAVAAVLVAGGAAFFLLSGSGGEEEQVVAAPRPASTAPAPVASPTPSIVVKAAQVSVTGRDPFRPLFSTPKPVSSPAPDAGASAAPQPSSSPTQTSAPAVAIGVTKVDPLGQTATVTVDGKAYKTELNKVFAKYFVVYSVFNAECVGVLYGDQSVPVCKGRVTTISP